MRAIFTTTDAEYADRNGEAVDVLHPLSENVAKYHGAKMMYAVRFVADGFLLDVFDKELTIGVEE